MMTAKSGVLAAFCCAAAALNPLAAQQADPITLSTEHPRLLLRPARLRLLRRERERTSMRWQQFFTLMAGHAPMPEPGVAEALYYQISGDKDAGARAIQWALETGGDLRQEALVFDWCLDLMSEAQQKQLAARLQKGMTDAAADESIAAVRSRAMAAIALFDHVPKGPQQELERTERTWWEGKLAPKLQAGEQVNRDDAYALMELLHVMRDNTNIDMRESARVFFKGFPMAHLLSYYPATFPAPENDYYLGAEPKTSQLDLRMAALSRMADMAMVAYDPNSFEGQMLQGWAMHDRYQLKGTFGAPYELLWANPYLPGLSYYHAPLSWHSPETGELYVRSSWEDNAKWFGVFAGVMQLFEDGKVTPVESVGLAAPVLMDQSAVCFGKGAKKFKVQVDEGEGKVYIVGLEPGHTYQVEVDDEEVFEADTDRAGTLEVEVPTGKEVGLRVR